jgi:hypothetical protein
MSEESAEVCCESEIPSTLDLAERCALALRGVANTSDPKDDGLFWFELYWNENPPYMEHSGCDIECGFKTLDNYFQLRHASGCDDYREREEQLLAFLISCVEDDGLFWVRYSPKRPWHLGAYAAFSSDYANKPADLAMPSSSGGLMAALALRNAVSEENGRYDDLLRRMARGLESAAVKCDDYAYFPDCKIGHPFCMPRGGWPNTKEPADEHETGEGTVVAYFGYPIQGLTRWAAQSGDEQALDLAGRFARFGMKRKFWGHPGDPDKMAGWEQGHVDSHFHARAIFLHGLLDYGLLTGDTNAVDFVRSSYEHMRAWGINRIGFIPTWVNGERTCMETCFAGDLVALTVKMSQAGVGDYWEDADCIIRNHLVEAQIMDRTHLDRIQAAAATSGKVTLEEADDTVPLTSRPTSLGGEPARENAVDVSQMSRDNVLDRCVGTFLSYLMPASAMNWRTMSCCEANGCRGLFYAWESITRCDGDDAEVNLLLNRAAPWLDVDSYLPYEGRAVIRNKTARRINVRIPSWVDRRELTCTINDRPCSPRFAGNRAVFGDLRPGDAIELRFPVKDWRIVRTAHARTAEEKVYSVDFRGNTVVDIYPRDDSRVLYPMYEREHLKTEGKSPVKKACRVIYESIPRW